jgi:GntR family transcriptional regulator
MTIRLQISETLRRRIETGELQALESIPSERELAQQLGVSRMTVRGAIDDLVDDGLLIRRQGRKTVVADEKISRAASFSSFSEEMRMRGWTPCSQVRQATTTIADVAIAAQLAIPIGALVIFLERLRYADEEPLALERVYLPYARFQNLLALDLASNSLYALLENEFGVRPVYAEESVEAVLLSTDEAALFRLEAGAPALLTRRVTTDEQDSVIEAATTLYRGDRYRMVLARRR